MSTATLSTKGQLVIPSRLWKALHLQPGDKVSIALEGAKLVVQRDQRRRAKVVEKNGRKVLAAPSGVPPMTNVPVKALLADFPVFRSKGGHYTAEQVEAVLDDE